ncbi:MAG: T9SS type A sorting domain-containing protein, partial [Bacteroidota bacterium]
VGLPSNGTLTIDGTPASIGSTFSQELVDNNLLQYTHDNSDTDSDAFQFEVLDAAGTWSNDHTFSIVIYDAALTAAPFVDMGLSCAGASDALVSINAFGGTAPYQYSLDGNTFQESNLFNGLGAGTYTFTIEDAMGLLFTTTELLIEEPLLLEASVSTELNTVTIVASGGTGALMYSLDGDTYQSDNVFPDLPNGDYTAYVLDENDCLQTVDFMILTTSTENPTNQLLFEVNPNPSRGTFTLRLLQETSNELVISIYDMVGKQLYAEDFGNVGNRFEQNIDLKHLDSGIYLLHVRSEQNIGTKRLVIVH